MNFGTILMSSSEVGIFNLTCFICLAAVVGVATVAFAPLDVLTPLYVYVMLSFALFVDTALGIV